MTQSSNLGTTTPPLLGAKHITPSEVVSIPSPLGEDIYCNFVSVGVKIDGDFSSDWGNSMLFPS